MNHAYLHWDVFTAEPLVGNPLAVFTDATGLDTPTMQRMAREMNFSESTFLLPPEQPGTDVRMRIFTPLQEMAHRGFVEPGRSRVVFGLNAGPTPVDLEWTGDQLRFAWMTQGPPVFGEDMDSRSLVAATLGLTLADLVADLPIQTVSCGVPLLFVPLRDRETVDRAVSDAAAFRRLGGVLGMDLPIFLFAVLPPGGAATVYSRMFAPSFGITEDPATGAATGPLGCYLVEHGVVSGVAQAAMRNLQGVAMGRPSEVHVVVDGTAGAITRVRVGGEAVLVGRGELFL
jgi:trans-2,3-dihydro-3-hydroxyanthranilate isomerase